MQNEETREGNAPPHAAAHRSADPDQIETAVRGNPEQLNALFSYLDPVKRMQVAAALPPKSLSEMPEMRRQAMKLRQPQQAVTSDLKEGKVFRALYSNRQLEEVLVDFWFNHFNVNEAKQGDRPVMASFEREAIRPNVFGHFKDLLLATARHPAMLYYLDNWESISPDVFDIGPFGGPAGQVVQQISRQAHGLNENYGRELMELHTLGVNGGYTQEDVIAVARCFTGWTIRKPNAQPEFVFAGFMHDMGEKTVLGHKIAANGEQDGLQVIDILAHHPVNGEVHFARTGAAFRSGRSAANAGGPHGGDVHEDGWRFARRDADDVPLDRVHERGRMAGEDEIAIRDGGQRGPCDGGRSDRHLHAGAKDRRIWASRFTAKSTPLVIRIPARHG